jgi:hypothetical protein
MILPLLHPGARRLSSYAEDGAEPDSRAGTARHLARCQRCRDFVAFRRSLSAAAAELSAPIPAADLRARILARRAKGDRVILPAQPPIPARPPVARYLTAACLLALIGVGTTTYVRRRESSEGVRRVAASIPSDQDSLPALRELLGTVFLPDLASAGELGAALIHVEAVGPQINGERILPRELVYERHYYLPDGHTRRLGGRGFLRIAPATERGRAVWKFDRRWTEYSAVPGHHDEVEIESITLGRRDLRMLQRSVRVTPYGRYDLINVSQDFHGDSVAGLMTTRGGDSKGVGRRFAQPLPQIASPFVSDAFAPLFFTAVPVQQNWRGRLSVIGWAVRDNDVFYPLEFRVVGREKVSVPAGTFDSWHLVISARARRYDLWIRVSDGLAVRARNETLLRTLGVGELVLVRAAPLAAVK